MILSTGLERRLSVLLKKKKALFRMQYLHRPLNNTYIFTQYILATDRL